MMNLQAGGLASKEPLCVQGREKAHSLSAFFSPPLAEGSVFSAVVENFGWSIKIFYRFSDMSSYLACLN